ncbi:MULTISPECIES: NUDIX hydrolase [Paenibacillus]|uniref:ADP-ribose pyrophosphatase n=1 Tax=Paenibacillus albilobatus TaxID=2716884 RepID=A0A920C9Y4_9BACL|nr:MULTISPECIES: NUDIX hydrolase [Paenibacillus]GIO31615.1 ADP-ribose pyrophosphatase [Paenibacillus albilobatus]
METSLKWLDWAKRIQGIAQTGLAYAKDVYDKERYEQLRELSLEIMAEYTEVETGKLTQLFAGEQGYATPKADIRGVVIQDGKILLVREKEDGDWSLPGGWADLLLSPTEIAVKEVWEESGYEVKAKRLLAVMDNHKHNPPAPYHVYKMFIQCEITGGTAREGVETSAVRFFGRDELPNLSRSRNTEAQIGLMFDLLAHPERIPVID